MQKIAQPVRYAYDAIPRVEQHTFPPFRRSCKEGNHYARDSVFLGVKCKISLVCLHLNSAEARQPDEKRSTMATAKQAWSEMRFKQQIDKSLEHIKLVLSTTKHPSWPSSVAHKYFDKYALVERSTSMAVVAMLRALGTLGVNEENWRAVVEQAEASNKATTLQFTATMNCDYDREELRSEDLGKEFIVESGKSDRPSIKHWSKAKVVHKVTEYIWKYKVKLLFVLCVGGEEVRMVLDKSGETEIVTTTKKAPHPKSKTLDSIVLNLTWLQKQTTLGEHETFAFRIDRDNDKCHTPRRNEEVAAAIELFSQVYNFSQSVQSFLREDIFPWQNKGKEELDLSSLNADGVFVPVVLVLDSETHEVLEMEDAHLLLLEQASTLSSKLASLDRIFGSSAGGVFTAVEARAVVGLLHAQDIAQYYRASVDSVEDMMRKQLIKAISQEIDASTFASYMRFHSQRLFLEGYRPSPFSFAVCRPEHSPEGAVEIFRDNDLLFTSMCAHNDPIISSHSQTMAFALNAATNVNFRGPHYVHAWLDHRFSSDRSSSSSISVRARARQFSSYILLLGRVQSGTSFDAKHAVILQNTDELTIPLLLETISAPKEFRDAIESLSPEQQRFARALRSMQLEGSVFGLVVVQIKPALERLLNLAPDSLTKEIRLTQDLMKLFIEFQIPSDLLSYDGPADASGETKLEQVYAHVAKMMEMIEAAKQQELYEVEQTSKFLKMDRGVSSDEEVIEDQGKVHAEMVRSEPRAMLAMPALTLRSAPPQRRMKSLAGGRHFFRGKPSSFGAASTPLSAPSPAGNSMEKSGPTPPSLPSPQAEEPMTERSSVSVAPDAAEGRAESNVEEEVEAGAEDGSAVLDYSKLPLELDQKYEAMDEDTAVHPTIINIGENWTLRRKKALLAKAEESRWQEEDQMREKKKAFDLLDALSRSGSLVLEDSVLHVVLAATHTFDLTLLETVIQRSINPVEKVERTALIMATTLYARHVHEIVKPSQLGRLREHAPSLFRLSDQAYQESSRQR